MTTHVPFTRSEPLTTKRKHPVCPACCGSLAMTWHRPAGRLASKVVPFHRYRCQVPTCQWEGHRRARAVVQQLPALADGAHTGNDVPAGNRAGANGGARRSTQRLWLTLVLLAALTSVAYWRSTRETAAPTPRSTAAVPDSPAHALDSEPVRTGLREVTTRVSMGSPSHRPAR